MAKATFFAKQNWNEFIIFLKENKIPQLLQVVALEIVFFYLTASPDKSILNSLTREELYKCYLDGGVVIWILNFLE